jgi:hypothetical protein
LAKIPPGVVSGNAPLQTLCQTVWQTVWQTCRDATSNCYQQDFPRPLRSPYEAVRLRQAKDTQLQAWASEIKLRAERKAGEMLCAMEKNRGGEHEHLSLRATGAIERSPTLPELGITRDNSSRWQKLAEVPERLTQECAVASFPASSKRMMRGSTSASFSRAQAVS